ncbi:MAG: hypothetical protein IKP22_02075 [Clostridia bacterium]|nr:hypothetical protein [Clostridia bacterium]
MTMEFEEEDRDEMVLRVISFGPTVRVLSPPDIRDSVIRKIKEQLRAWKIIEKQFLLPYGNRIYPKRIREKYDLSGLPVTVEIGEVIALIMELI